MRFKVLVSQICIAIALESMTVIAALEVADEVADRNVLHRVGAETHHVLEYLRIGIFFALVVRVLACSLRVFEEVSEFNRRVLEMFPCIRVLVEFLILH